MNPLVRKLMIVASLPLLWLVGLDRTEVLPLPVIAGTVQAVVGVPVSPMSVGGVARRTTRRTVAYTSAASASAASTAPTQQPTQQQAAPAPAAPPKGSVVTALPSGCSSISIDGSSFFECSGTIYKPTFQSSNLVYEVQ